MYIENITVQNINVKHCAFITIKTLTSHFAILSKSPKIRYLYSGFTLYPHKLLKGYLILNRKISNVS